MLNNFELQENQRSAYFDLSPLYSDDAQELNNLRGGCKGCLKTNKNNILPEEKCSTGQCYVAGDPRATQTFTITVIHAILTRAHNVIAEKFAEINSQWDNDRVFFESRRLLIAIFQRILYHEWLPLVLGMLHVPIANFKFKLNSINEFLLYFIRQIDVFE